jgi:hypothetical protein
MYQVESAPSYFAPENCYICGYSKEIHTENAGHKFWSNAEAETDFANTGLTK